MLNQVIKQLKCAAIEAQPYEERAASAILNKDNINIVRTVPLNFTDYSIKFFVKEST